MQIKTVQEQIGVQCKYNAVKVCAGGVKKLFKSWEDDGSGKPNKGRALGMYLLHVAPILIPFIVQTTIKTSEFYRENMEPVF